MTSITVLGLSAKINDALLKANLDTVEDFLLNAPLDGDHQQEQPSSRSKRKSFTGSMLTPAQQIALRSLTVQELESVYDQASAYIFQGIAFGTGRDLLQEQHWLTLGDPLLDETLGGGGIMTRSITEIVGESSAGKTQFCLQLCLTVQLPRHLGGLDGSVVWLSTEGKFAYTRLEAMIPSFLAKYKDAGIDLTPESIRDNIYFDAMADQETQLHIFNYQLPILIEDTHAMADAQEADEGPTQPTQVMGDSESSMSMDSVTGTTTQDSRDIEPTGSEVRRKPIRLIIVDSITNNFRSEMDMRASEGTGDTAATAGIALAGQAERGSNSGGGGSSMKASLVQRSADLCETGIRLRTLADQFNLAVVCINQVSDVFDTTDNESHSSEGVGADIAAVATQGRSIDTGFETRGSGSKGGGNAGNVGAGRPLATRHPWSHAMRKLKPALGLVWENTVNTRLLLERTSPTFLSAASSAMLAQFQFPAPPPPPDSPPEVLQAFAHECERVQAQRDRVLARQEPIRVMSVLFSPWTPTKGAWCRYSIQQDGVVGVPR